MALKAQLNGKARRELRMNVPRLIGCAESDDCVADSELVDSSLRESKMKLAEKG